jgi:hypothetical protein
VYEDQFAESPKGSVVVRATNRGTGGKETGTWFS